MAETSITRALAMEEQGLILAALMGLSAFFSMAETSISMLWPWKLGNIGVNALVSEAATAIFGEAGISPTTGVN
ncbi:hypothetical protein Dsin_023459 [Dipteronia sinensis]|uniref:CNNM transmembrane domain-containing protein n=1 Tax=Dipteronia sinensis TaxID=43782 RepID=A0AAE0A3L6_9ROSI|nr:hypothetical protein Dsin_023459 [Dipteronia sinensis]